MVGTCNAVNLTDGMDGLAIGCTNSAFVAYLIMAYVTGPRDFCRVSPSGLYSLILVS